MGRTFYLLFFVFAAFIAPGKQTVVAARRAPFSHASWSLTTAQQPRIRTLRPLISAHRGASRLAPENTLLAFTKAIEAGADFIEIDVRTTSDGAQVIVHDGSLKRTTGLDAKVEATTLATIRALSAGGITQPAEKVPTLEEVCALVVSMNSSGYSAKLYVDCKAIRADKVVETLTRHNLIASAVFYGDVKTLTEIKKRYAAARVMPAYPGHGSMADVERQLKPYAFDVSFEQLNAGLVKACHNKGIRVFCDLLDEEDKPDSYRKAIRAGVDLIQTDDVSGVKKVFNEFEWITE